MHELRIGSLFSGIGGFDLGLERTGGFRTAWFCEQDEFCQHVLAQHWPGVPCYPDVTALRGADVEPVEIIVGGFPCQDLSLAGPGAGLDGARSGLWSEYARLIGELRPRYVIVENVAALLARGLGTVLADLAALGYDAEWDCIPASAVGAPHQRDRIWLVAYPERVELREQPEPQCGSEGPALVGVDGSAQPVADAQGRSGDGRGAGTLADPTGNGRRSRRSGGSAREGQDRADVSAPGVEDAEGERRAAQRPHGPGEAGSDGVAGPAGERPGSAPWAVEPDVGRVADGVPARVDRLRALGNALVPQIPEWIGLRILEWEHAHD